RIYRRRYIGRTRIHIGERLAIVVRRQHRDAPAQTARIVTYDITLVLYARIVVMDLDGFRLRSTRISTLEPADDVVLDPELGTILPLYGRTIRRARPGIIAAAAGLREALRLRIHFDRIRPGQVIHRRRLGRRIEDLVTRRR